jgi:predicted nuclease with TOPRIM domain
MEHGEITKKEYDDYMKYYKENLREIIVESAELKAELERLKGKYEIVNEP